MPVKADPQMIPNAQMPAQLPAVGAGSTALEMGAGRIDTIFHWNEKGTPEGAFPCRAFS
jgi:hypothetical protein